MARNMYTIHSVTFKSRWSQKACNKNIHPSVSTHLTLYRKRAGKQQSWMKFGDIGLKGAFLKTLKNLLDLLLTVKQEYILCISGFLAVSLPAVGRSLWTLTLWALIPRTLRILTSRTFAYEHLPREYLLHRYLPHEHLLPHTYLMNTYVTNTYPKTLTSRILI